MEDVFERTALAAEFEERHGVLRRELEHCSSYLRVVAVRYRQLPLLAVLLHCRYAGDGLQALRRHFPVKLNDDCAAGVVGFEGGDGVVCHDVAFADDYGAVAHCLRFLHYVRGEDDGLFLAEFFDEAADFNDLVGVEACGRLVEDEYLRVVNHCAGYACALAVSGRTY